MNLFELKWVLFWNKSITEKKECNEGKKSKIKKINSFSSHFFKITSLRDLSNLIHQKNLTHSLNQKSRRTEREIIINIVSYT